MGIFEISIAEIKSERTAKRGVFVDVVTDFYCGKQEQALYFDKSIWERVKVRRRYIETEGRDAGFGEYLESLSDEEYYRRFECDIKKFSDKEIVDEINRRVDSGLFSHIGYEVKAVIKEK